MYKNNKCCLKLILKLGFYIEYSLAQNGRGAKLCSK